MAGPYILITANDIKGIQASLRTGITGVDTTMAQCPSLDAGTRNVWAMDSAPIRQYVSQTPVNFFPGSGEVYATWDLYNQGVEYQQLVLAWQQKLSAQCKTTYALIRPGSDSPDNTENLIRLGMIAITTVAVAYAVAKVAPAIANITSKKSSGE